MIRNNKVCYGVRKYSSNTNEMTTINRNSTVLELKMFKFKY